MKKIGFIDYYLDEWHANNYPTMIQKAADDMTVAMAYGKIDPKEGLTNSEWCKKNHIEQASSIEKLVDACDYVVVLSPDNPEQHESLSEIPLKSGKRIYIDKTFATDRAAAERMFSMAEKYHTPMYSTSALRFSNEFRDIKREGISFVSGRGPGSFEIEGIHEFEPVVFLMGTELKRLMFIGNQVSPAFVIEYRDGRKAVTSHFGWDCPFGFAINYESGEVGLINECTDFFDNFIFKLLDYFRTGDVKVDSRETLAVVSIIEAGYKAVKKPDEWVEIG